MTDVSRIADSTWFRVIVPVLQMVLAASATGAFIYVVGSLSSLQTSLNAYQTTQALIAQRVDGLERSRDANDKIVDGLRSTTQRLDYQVNGIAESLKNLVLTGRPK